MRFHSDVRHASSLVYSHEHYASFRPAAPSASDVSAAKATEQAACRLSGSPMALKQPAGGRPKSNGVAATAAAGWRPTLSDHECVSSPGELVEGAVVRAVTLDDARRYSLPARRAESASANPILTGAFGGRTG